VFALAFFGLCVCFSHLQNRPVLARAQPGAPSEQHAPQHVLCAQTAIVELHLLALRPMLAACSGKTNNTPPCFVVNSTPDCIVFGPSLSRLGTRLNFIALEEN
jgi:hypothetical protein